MVAARIKKYSFRFFILFVVVVVCILPSAQQVSAAHVDVDWTTHPAASASEWFGITWSSELGLFVATSALGGDQIMTSPDGINWTARTAAASNQWREVTWSPELNLFVTVASTGTNRVMTSPDGINWTTQTATEPSEWWGVTWSPEQSLFVAVARSGTNQIMTSPDGVTWTTQTAPANDWYDVTWSPERGVFVAVGAAGTDRVATSPDGVNWTPVAAGGGSQWRSVTWSPELGMFVAVGASVAMSSPDGVTWTPHTVDSNTWSGVVWSPELGMFAAVATAGADQIMTSEDGMNWNSQPAPEANPWYSITWSPELGTFAAVSYNGADRVMTGTPLAAVPSAPVNLTATASGSNQAQLRWDAAASDNPYSPVTGYKIERSINGGPFAVLVADTQTTDTTYHDIDLSSEATYTYRVSAITAAGVGDPSNQATVSMASSAITVHSDTLAPTGGNNYLFRAVGILFAVTGVGLGYYRIKADVFRKIKL